LADEGIGCIRLLEIGIGSGNNLKFYPNNTRLISVEPNSHFDTYFEKNRKKFPNIILEKSIAGTAEDMSTIADNSIDVVVSTHVLCSVSDVQTCLNEIKRVLIPNGKFIYVEHVAYETGTFCRRLQTSVEWIWKIFNDDCRLTAETSQLIREAEFSSVDEQYCIVNELSIGLIRPHIFGTATK
jgi:ubiquinone/menaquinone biosynthesis C-methylase UbiE